jgi:16S rRNA (guanine527-N7)-methyltransferase
VQEGRQRLAVLARGAEALGLSLSPAQLDAFAVYLEELLRASPAADLTAVREPDEVQRRHFLESLALGVALVRLGLLPEGQAVRAIDIGTGGGLPGLPLRIVWPSLRLTLLDSERRKTEFVRSLLSRLGLPDVEVVWGRAEEVARDPRHRQAYDLALARALAPLPVLAELALPFLRLGGHLVSPKGERVQREVAEAGRALSECGGEVVWLGPLSLPYPAPPPTLLVVRKVAPTPERYPRRPGIPAKRPLR